MAFFIFLAEFVNLLTSILMAFFFVLVLCYAKNEKTSTNLYTTLL